MLKNVVDSMVTTKLNALHLHLVDSQAFPLVLPSAPRLSKGAYSSQEQYVNEPAFFALATVGDYSVHVDHNPSLFLPRCRYTLSDLADLTAYATARGVRPEA